MPVLHGGWWYVTRTIEGKSYPVFCRSRDAEVPDTPDARDPRLQRRGRGPRVLRRPRRRAVAGSHPARLVERRRRQRALHAARPRPRHRRAIATRSPSTSSWGGVAWSAGNDWLFYARPDDQMRPHQIWRHRLGTSPADDVLVHSEDDERFFLSVSATRSGRWIVHHGGVEDERRVVRPARRRSGGHAATRPAADARRRVRHRRLGRPLRRAHQPRRPRLPPDDGARTTTRAAWSDLVAHEAGRRLTEAEPFADHLVAARVDGGPTAGPRAAPRRHVRGARLR